MDALRLGAAAIAAVAIGGCGAPWDTATLPPNPNPTSDSAVVIGVVPVLEQGGEGETPVEARQHPRDVASVRGLRSRLAAGPV